MSGNEKKRAQAIELTNRAFYDVERGDFRRARVKLEKALRLADDIADIHNEYALILRNFGEHTKARQHLSRATELEPENPKCWSGLAGWYIQHRDWKNAEACIDIVENLNPRYPTIELAKASISEASGATFEEAEEHKKRAREIYESTRRRADGTPLKPGYLEKLLSRDSEFT